MGTSRNTKQSVSRPRRMPVDPYSQQVSIVKCIHIEPTLDHVLTGGKYSCMECDPSRVPSSRCKQWTTTVKQRNGAMDRNACSHHRGHHFQSPHRLPHPHRHHHQPKTMSNPSPLLETGRASERIADTVPTKKRGSENKIRGTELP